MNRAQGTTLAFAVLAVVVTLATAFMAQRGVERAFERESAERLRQLAELAASQLSAADLANAHVLGAEGTGLLNVQAQLDGLQAATLLTDVAVLDDSARVVYDVRAGLVEPGAPSAYDSLASAAMALARAGRGVPLPAFRRSGHEARAAAAPVPGVPGYVLVTEGAPGWEPQLARLRRDLGLLAAVSVLAIAALAALVLRANASQWALERRLSRSENLAAMGRMTATLAHEIKNPLAIIRGSAKRLGKLAPEALTMADSVVEEVDRLSGTVNRYLQFARGGPAEPGSHGDAAATLAATVDLLAPEFRSRGCALEREGEAECRVPLDDASLKQVWLNLLQNALEALPEGGRARATCTREGVRIRVVISDDGPGMPAAVLARLGEPFYTTRAQGTGLGLHLSRQLVTGAGGSLAVESREGQGTSVTVELPSV
jgi:signal transduction histidine kinase